MKLEVLFLCACCSLFSSKFFFFFSVCSVLKKDKRNVLLAPLALLLVAVEPYAPVCACSGSDLCFWCQVVLLHGLGS